MPGIPKYKPQTSKVKPWAAIEDFYVDLIANYGWEQYLLDLVRHIRSTRLSDRLYACTSLDRLIVSIYDPIEFNKEVLIIAYNRSKQKWHFTYRAQPFAPIEFEREYEPSKGIEKFDNFIKMIRW